MAKKAPQRQKRPPQRAGPRSRRPAAEVRLPKGAARPGKAGAQGVPSGRQEPAGEGQSRLAKPAKRPKRRRAPKARGGRHRREDTLAQTPETGRSVRGRTNPMPTAVHRHRGRRGHPPAPGLERERKRLREVEESVQGRRRASTWIGTVRRRAPAAPS